MGFVLNWRRDIWSLGYWGQDIWSSPFGRNNSGHKGSTLSILSEENLRKFKKMTKLRNTIEEFIFVFKRLQRKWREYTFIRFFSYFSGMHEWCSRSLFGTYRTRCRWDWESFVQIKSHGCAYCENDDRRI